MCCRRYFGECSCFPHRTYRWLSFLDSGRVMGINTRFSCGLCGLILRSSSFRCRLLIPSLWKSLSLLFHPTLSLCWLGLFNRCRFMGRFGWWCDRDGVRWTILCRLWDWWGYRLLLFAFRLSGIDLCWFCFMPLLTLYRSSGSWRPPFFLLIVWSLRWKQYWQPSHKDGLHWFPFLSNTI